MSVQKTSQGKFKVRWRIDGKHHSKVFDRKVDAEKFESKITSDGEKILTDDRKISFSEFVQLWMENYAEARKLESSCNEDRIIARKYLLPAFGNKPLRSLSLQEIEALRSDLKRSGLGHKTLNNIFGLLHRMLVVAVRWNYLRFNACAHLEPLKIHKTEMKYWTFAELESFLNFSRGNDLQTYDFVAFAANTGLRYGEIRGLLPDCIDSDRNEIIVTRTFCSRENRIVQRTKGMRSRRVPMNVLVREIVNRRRDHLLSEPLFKDFNLSNFRNRKFLTACDNAQVRRIRFHDLRHTFGSHLAMRGVSILKIKELMGHTDIKVTMRYMHLAPSELDGVTDVLMPRLPAHLANQVVNIF